MNATPRRWPRRLLIAFLVFAVLYTGYRYTLHRFVQAKLDEIRQQGYPVTLAELDAYYPTPPPGQNAADIYLEAFKHFAPRQDSDTNLPIVGYAKLPPRGEPMSDEMKKAVAGYLKQNDEAVALLEKAATIGQSRFPLDVKAGLARRLTHLSQLRNGARLLCLKATAAAEAGDAAGASETLVSSLKLGDSLAAEPTAISHLVKVACHRISVSHLERALNTVRFTDAQLTNLAAALGEAERAQKIERVFVGERCDGIVAIQNLGFPSFRMLFGGPELELLAMERVSSRYLWMYAVAGWQELDLLSYIGVLNGYVRTTEVSAPERLRNVQIISRDVNAMPKRRIMTRLLCGALDYVFSKDSRCLALLRDANTAVAIERYRLAHGALPVKFTDLVPAYLDVVPQDPFDGQPLRYKKLAKGYVVYSVGDDGKDDGRIERDAEGHQFVEGTDITFTVEQ